MASETVSRFGLIFHANTRQAERSLDRMGKSFQHMETTLLALEGIASRVFMQITGGLFNMGKSFVDTAAKLEATKTQLMFAFRELGSDAGAEIYEKSIEAGLRMVQTTDEVINTVTMMQRMAGVNVFDPEIEKAMGRVNDQGLKFVDLLGDMASVNQTGMEGVLWGLSGALTGNWQQARRRLDVDLGEMKKAMAGASTEAEKLAAAVPFLFNKWGGASAALADTWSFMAAQLDDIRDKLFATFGAPLMNALKPSLSTFVEYFVGPRGVLSRERGKEWDALTGALGRIGGHLGEIAKTAGAVGRSMLEFVQRKPQIVEFALAVAAVTAGFIGLIAAGLMLKTAMFAISVASPFVAIVGALTLGAGLLARWAVKGKGIADTFERFRIVGEGVMELVSSLNRGIGEISEETAKAAEDRGILGLTIKLGMFAFRAQQFFRGFVDQMKEGWILVKTAFAPAIEGLLKLFGVAGSAATSDVAKWEAAGRTLATLFTTVATAMGRIASFVTQAIELVASNKGLIASLGALFVGRKLLAGFAGRAAGMPGAAFSGATPVFVVNMPGGGLGGGLGPGAGRAAGAGAKAGKLAMLGRFLGAASAVATAGFAGYELGNVINEQTKKSNLFEGRSLSEWLGDSVAMALDPTLQQQKSAQEQAALQAAINAQQASASFPDPRAPNSSQMSSRLQHITVRVGNDKLGTAVVRSDELERERSGVGMMSFAR